MSLYRTGTALAITISLLYSLCTLVWVLLPGPFLGFINSLFHGLDFARLASAGQFVLSDFLIALVVLSVWAWVTGAVFAWTSNRLAP